MEPPTIKVIITLASESESEPIGSEIQNTFHEAIEACRPYLLQVAASQLGSDLRPKGDASDLVQQTYLEAHRDIKTFEGRTLGEMKAWLRQILLNNLKQFARRYRASAKRRIDREVPLEPRSTGPESLVSETASPSRQVIAQERSQAVRAALALLSEQSLKSVLGRAHDDRTFREIGTDLGCSSVAARKLWIRSIARLRRELKSLASDSTSQFPRDEAGR
jgi:RNA polymerase sigma-70 factor (ECF subfamily)